MNDDGYTLVEMLAALMIIGLAIGGLTQAVRVIGLGQGAAVRAMGQARALRSAHMGLARLVEDQGPFVSDQAGGPSGSGSDFSFDCAASAPCGAVLAERAPGQRLTFSRAAGPALATDLAGEHGAGLVYGGDQMSGQAWPPRAPERQTLRWIALVGGSDTAPAPIASARLWREEAPGCVFDVIAQACRPTAP